MWKAAGEAKAAPSYQVGATNQAARWESGGCAGGASSGVAAGHSHSHEPTDRAELCPHTGAQGLWGRKSWGRFCLTLANDFCSLSFGALSCEMGMVPTPFGIRWGVSM